MNKPMEERTLTDEQRQDIEKLMQLPPEAYKSVMDFAAGLMAASKLGKTPAA